MEEHLTGSVEILAFAMKVKDDIALIMVCEKVSNA